MKFSDIISHENTKEQLVALVDSGRVPHALLLHGRAGIGKLQMARAFISYLHCTNRKNGDSCGVCPACRQQASFNHIDTHFSFPVYKPKGWTRNPVSDDFIEQWRAFLTNHRYAEIEKWIELLDCGGSQPQFYVDESMGLIKKLNFTAHASKYKTVLMWLPERMNEATANKLLKIVEEPHEDTIFVLVSNEPDKILPTIFSRLRRIEMRRLPESVISSVLQEQYNIDPTSADFAAHLAEGSLPKAIQALSSNENDRTNLDLFIRLMRLAYQRKILDLRKWSLEAAGLGREELAAFLTYCERLLGENFILNLNRPDLIYMTGDEYNFSKNFARFINERNVEKLRKLFIDARNDVLGNGNAKIIMFDVAVKTILLLK